MADTSESMDVDAGPSEKKDKKPAKDKGAAKENVKPVFEVKKWNAVALWGWDIQVDNCAICRNSLMEPSIDNQALGVDEVTIAWGVCNHCFHLECIQRWLKTRYVCPLCGMQLLFFFLFYIIIIFF